MSVEEYKPLFGPNGEDEDEDDDNGDNHKAEHEENEDEIQSKFEKDSERKASQFKKKGIVQLRMEQLKAQFPKMTLHSKIFLLLVIIQSMALISLGIVVLVGEHQSCYEEGELIMCDTSWRTYAFVYIYTTFFFLSFAIDSIRNENSIAMVFFLLTSFILVTFGGLQLNNPTEITTKEIIFLSLFGGFEIAYFYLLYKMHREFRWKIFKKIGPDPVLRKMYKEYRMFCGLLKATLLIDSICLILGSSYFVVSFMLWQFGQLEGEGCDSCIIEFVLTMVAFIVDLCAFFMVKKGVRTERKNFVILGGLFFFGLLGFFALRVYYFLIRDYQYTKMPLAVFLTIVGIAVVIRIPLCYVTIECYKNFGFGFKKVVNVHEPESKPFIRELENDSLLAPYESEI